MAKKKTLYAYATGNKDSAEATVHADPVVTAVEKRLDALVAGRTWVSKDVWVVNQREPPHWDLGLNLAVPTGRALSASFLDDVVAIANELGALHRETSCSFVIGVHDGASDDTKDLFVVDAASPDLERLRASVTGALGLK